MFLGVCWGSGACRWGGNPSFVSEEARCGLCVFNGGNSKTVEAEGWICAPLNRTAVGNPTERESNEDRSEVAALHTNNLFWLMHLESNMIAARIMFSANIFFLYETISSFLLHPFLTWQKNKNKLASQPTSGKEVDRQSADKMSTSQVNDSSSAWHLSELTFKMNAGHRVRDNYTGLAKVIV